MNRKQFFVLNAISIGIYVVCWILLEFEISEELMFSTNDSRSYLAVTDWIFGGEVTGHTAKRPLLFPLMMALPYKLAGVYGVWFLQFSCWLVGINLCFRASIRWSKKNVIGWIVLGVLVSNLSLISMTFHGLTELPTFFFLSVLIYFVVSKIEQFKSVYFIHGVLFILVLLTLVKGVFYYMVLLCILTLVVFYGRKYIRKPRLILWFVLILLPLVGQMTMVKVVHGEFVVSTIGGDTFNNYYFTRAMVEIEGREREEVLDHVAKLTSEEKVDYILGHKRIFFNQFTRNIGENIRGRPIYVNFGKEEQHKIAFTYMENRNRVVYLLHWIGMILVLIVAFFAVRRKRYSELTLVLIISGLTLYYLVTTGLSFWQGDRLVLPAIALWSTLYSVMIIRAIKGFQSVRKRR